MSTDYSTRRSELIKQTQDEMAELCQRALQAGPTLASMANIKTAESPHKVIYREGKMRLLHYKTRLQRTHDTPILIVYALINRYQILDVQDKSMVKSLVDSGFDVYLIDWGTPSDSKSTIDDYVNYYLDAMVDVVRKTSGSEKVSLVGYCMGGTFSAIYTSLHKSKVKNLITIAPPVDCSKETTVFGTISKHIDIDTIIDNLRNMPPELQHLFFFMLKPFKHHIEKYNQMVDRHEDELFINNSLRAERWLWDTPPISGEVFRQWVKDIYQRNLLIQNSLTVGNNTINLKNIDVPFLNIVAEQDHLVSPESSKALNYAISSKDRTLMSFQTGHVGLCASSYSKKEIWPSVGEWLIDRS